MNTIFLNIPNERKQNEISLLKQDIVSNTLSSIKTTFKN